jgi:hypothetical protein
MHPCSYYVTERSMGKQKCPFYNTTKRVQNITMIFETFFKKLIQADRKKSWLRLCKCMILQVTKSFKRELE